MILFWAGKREGSIALFRTSRFFGKQAEKSIPLTAACFFPGCISWCSTAEQGLPLVYPDYSSYVTLALTRGSSSVQ